MKTIKANLNDWKVLYEVADKLKNMKPWGLFADTDLIVLEYLNSEPIFISILGNNKQTYGLVAYEGYYGLATYYMLVDEDENHISSRYLMFNQACLTAYWGDRQEISTDYHKIIKDLGYRFHGRNQWLYFMSFLPSHFPHMLNQNEVQRLSEYYQVLIDAITYYKENELNIDFNGHNGYWFSFDQNNQAWVGYEADLPEVGEVIPQINLSTSIHWNDLKASKSYSNMMLEIDAVYTGIVDEEGVFGRPILGQMIVIVDAESSMIIDAQLLDIGEDKYSGLVDVLMDHLLEHGIPQTLAVRYDFFGELLEPLADFFDIPLFVSGVLPACDEAIDNLLDHFD